MRLPIATALLAVVIFVVDVLTPTEVSINWAYVIVVLLAAQFLRTRGVVLVTLGCVALSALGSLVDVALEPPPPEILRATLVDRALSILALVVTTFLVLQQQASDRALRQQAQLLNLTYDSIFSRTMDDVITFWNHAAEEMYGWTPVEAVGKQAQPLLQTVFPTPVQVIKSELLRTGKWEGELTNQKRDGTQIVVASRWSLQTDMDGRPTAILETNNDITERKQTQEALGEAQANLTRTNRLMLVGEMTSSIAHEINQPLTGVVSNAGTSLRWLSAQPPNLDEVRHYLGLIVRDGNRASEVIARVRQLVRKHSPSTAQMDINDALLEVVALANSELQKNSVRVHTELSNNLPLVMADRVQVQQVMLNLISNATEAMSSMSDGLRELDIVTGVSDSKEVFVEVRDSGPGLDPNSIGSLFNSFYTTKPNGMGMGLSISRTIVEAHGGRLHASQNEPTGAVFRFTLPIEDEREREPIA